MSEPMIVYDSTLIMGKPLAAGTRITTDLVLEKLGAGESIEAVLESHPRLSRKGVLPALRYAAQALRAEVADPTSAKSA